MSWLICHLNIILQQQKQETYYPVHEVIHNITNKIGLSRLFATVSLYRKVKLNKKVCLSLALKN